MYAMRSWAVSIIATLQTIIKTFSLSSLSLPIEVIILCVCNWFIWMNHILYIVFAYRVLRKWLKIYFLMRFHRKLCVSIITFTQCIIVCNIFLLVYLFLFPKSSLDQISHIFFFFILILINSIKFWKWTIFHRGKECVNAN